MGSAAIKPMTAKATPLIRLMVTEVCTASLSFSVFLPPKYFPANTLEPTERPMKRLVSRFISDVVEPTAARELSPAKRPTTMMSAALKSICRMLENIRGKANISIFFNIGPLTISISCFFTFFPFDSLTLSSTSTPTLLPPQTLLLK